MADLSRTERTVLEALLELQGDSERAFSAEEVGNEADVLDSTAAKALEDCHFPLRLVVRFNRNGISVYRAHRDRVAVVLGLVAGVETVITATPRARLSPLAERLSA